MIAYGTPKRFYLPMLTLSGNPDTAQTPTVQISKDGGDYVVSSGTLRRVGATHVWTYLPTVAESQADTLNILATATGDVPFTATQYTENTYTTAKAAYLDASISGIAASVWAYVTRTLTSFGTLADDVAAIKAKVVALQALVDVATSTAATPEETLAIVEDAVDNVLAACANPASPTPIEQQQLDNLAAIYATVQASQTAASAAANQAVVLSKFVEVQANLDALAKPEDAMGLTAVALASIRDGLATTADAQDIQQAVQALPTPPTPDEIAVVVNAAHPDDIPTDDLAAIQHSIQGLPSAGTIAAAVWGAANRTLSSFGSLVEQIATTITAIFTAPTSRPPSSSSRHSLADAVANDVYTFLNASEFGRVRDVNGSMILCVLMKNSLHPSGGTIDAGMADDQWTLQCATADLPCQPMPTERLRVDNVLYLVDESADNQGMMTVKMTRPTV